MGRHLRTGKIAIEKPHPGFGMRFFVRIRFLPAEGEQAVDVQRRDADGDEVLEDRLHPVLYLQSLARVGLGQEFVPAPADLVAAEHREYQRAQRQQVGAHDEVPEIQPGAAVGKGLEVEHAVAQGGGQSQQEDARPADRPWAG